jgi:hypothetical protein
MNRQERAAILEDELLILADSGEIPEIAFHSTLHYLTEDPDGPQLNLTGKELHLLQDAALNRYRQIILRDLDPANRDLSIYRGIRRSIYNWQRMLDFSSRSNRDISTQFQEIVAAALLAFLEQELADVNSDKRISSVNCSASELLTFAAALDIAVPDLPADWQKLCSE